MTLFNKFRKKKERTISPLLPIGFHGDRFLLTLVDTLFQSCSTFIETGTNVGSTLCYVARTYPQIVCFSCEPDEIAFDQALKNCGIFPQTYLYNETSPSFLKMIIKEHPYLIEKANLFWLDAHGYGFKWPLREEIKIITTHFPSANILIDDFKVPGLEVFGFDSYMGQECSLEYIKPALNQDRKYRIYYPTYTENTSEFHPLRGWGYICYGKYAAKNIEKTMGENINRYLEIP